MKRIEFLQNGLIHSAEELVKAHSNVNAFLEQLAKEKESAIAKKILGKEFPCSDLISSNNWSYKYYNGKTLKAVAIEAKPADNDLVCGVKEKKEYNSVIELSIIFLRKIDVMSIEFMNSTAKEMSLLRKLSKMYDCKNVKFAEIENADKEIRYLKNGYNLCHTLIWRYDFDSVISDDFVYEGIRANVALTL